MWRDEADEADRAGADNGDCGQHRAGDKEQRAPGFKLQFPTARERSSPDARTFNRRATKTQHRGEERSAPGTAPTATAPNSSRLRARTPCRGPAPLSQPPGARSRAHRRRLPRPHRSGEVAPFRRPARGGRRGQPMRVRQRPRSTARPGRPILRAWRRARRPLRPRRPRAHRDRPAGFLKTRQHSRECQEAPHAEGRQHPRQAHLEEDASDGFIVGAGQGAEHPWEADR